MSAARPTDWSAVDLWADPVPGDPDVVASFGGMMTRTAETIETASQSLRRISYTNVSKASSQVRSQAINVAAQLDRAHSRTSVEQHPSAARMEMAVEVSDWGVLWLRRLSTGRGGTGFP